MKPRMLAAVCLVVAGCQPPPSPPAPETAVRKVEPVSPAVDPPAPALQEPNQKVGHVRVILKKVSIGKVPIRGADGRVTHSDEPRLMVAVRIENQSDRRGAEYRSWVPDLTEQKSVAVLKDDSGLELNRITFGFGNNVKDRTVLDTLSPGKSIGDLLVFEAPGPNARQLQLTLPGANVGVNGAFSFSIDVASIERRSKP